MEKKPERTTLFLLISALMGDPDMMQYIEQQRGKWHYGPEVGESAQAKAEQLLAQELRREGAGEEELSRWRKGHPVKVRLAARRRAETTVILEWIIIDPLWHRRR